MRKALAVALTACLLLCGCDGNGIKREGNAPKPNASGRFLCDRDDYSFGTVVDSQTGVTYLVWNDRGSYGGHSGITVLLDKDGKPIISEEVTS